MRIENPRVYLVLLLVAALAGAGLYWRHASAAAATSGDASGSRGGGKKGMNGPMPVQVRPVVTGDLNIYITGLGTVTPTNSVTVHPRVDGQLMSINFNEGETVRAGQLLAQIDPRPYQVALTQALGQLAKDQATLAGARVDQARYQGLLAQDSISRQQVDSQNALVQQYEGTVKADQGAVDSARLNLSYARVTAPASGQVGLQQVDPGNVVHASDTNGIVIINQVQPINVLFTIPEDSVAVVAAHVHKGDTLSVEAWDREQKARLATGRLASMDNQIDTATGTVRIKSLFANKDGVLFANQFVNARLLVETRHGVTLIPAAAVQRGSSGVFVFVVSQDQHVSVRQISIGPVDGDNVQVLTGLTPGETVVIDGADKLKDGGKVSVVTPPVPGAEAKPHKGNGQPRRHADAAP
jgi:multidrug efflux system membrane fusion protein